jgi:hypothetical protein
MLKFLYIFQYGICSPLNQRKKTMKIRLKIVEKLITFHVYFETTSFLVNEDERDRTYSTHGGSIHSCKTMVGNLKKKVFMETETSMSGIILKWA